MSRESDTSRERVMRALGGDRGEFDALCRELEPRLLATIRNLLGKSARGRIEPEDILQDTLTKAWTSRAEFAWQGSGSILRWFEAIARHGALHLSRRELRRSELLRLYRPGDARASPSLGLQRVERFERLRSAIESLRPPYRDVLLLARIEGRSIRDIARALRKSESAVKGLLVRATEALRRTLDDTDSLTLPKDRRLGESAEDPDGL